MQAVHTPKADLISLIQARGQRLQADATDPHRGVALCENQCDEALITGAYGDNIGEMRAAANAVNGVYRRQSYFGLAVGGLGLAAAVAGIALGCPGLALGGAVTAMGGTVLSGHFQAKQVPNNNLVEALNRWQGAIEAANNGGPAPTPAPPPAPAPEPASAPEPPPAPAAEEQPAHA